LFTLQKPRRDSGSLPTSAVVLPLSFVGDDVALVKALKANHPGAKAVLFDRYVEHVERVVYHVLGIDPEAKDVVHDVFVNAFASIHGLSEPSALKAWLSRVAALTAKKLLRTRKRRSWLKLFVDSEEEVYYEPWREGVNPEDVETVRETYALLSQMPVDERMVFTLRFIEGMELSEVGVACDVSLATVKRRLRKAMDRFTRMAVRRPVLAEQLNGGARWQDL
jgi:RNA polymerase sigma-70 factor (ECF subfamily)